MTHTHVVLTIFVPNFYPYFLFWPLTHVNELCTSRDTSVLKELNLVRRVLKKLTSGTKHYIISIIDIKLRRKTKMHSFFCVWVYYVCYNFLYIFFSTMTEKDWHMHLHTKVGWHCYFLWFCRIYQLWGQMNGMI